MPARETVKVYNSKGFNMNYWKSYYPVESSMLNAAAGSANVEGLHNGAFGRSVSVPQSTSTQVKFCLDPGFVLPGITVKAGKQ